LSLTFCLSVCLSVSFSVCQFFCLSVFLSVFLSVSLSFSLSFCLPVYQSNLFIYLRNYASFCRHVCFSVYLFFCSSVCTFTSPTNNLSLSVCLFSVSQFVCLFACLLSISPSVSLSLCLSFGLSVSLPVHQSNLSLYLYNYASLCRHVCLSVYLSFCSYIRPIVSHFLRLLVRRKLLQLTFLTYFCPNLK
jgi:hypothetical protein